MTLTYGLIGAGALLLLGFAAFWMRRTPAPEAAPEVVRVTRKNRPARKPTRDHVGRRAERP